MFIEYRNQYKQNSQFVIVLETGQDYYFVLPDTENSTDNLDHAIELTLNNEEK